MVCKWSISKNINDPNDYGLDWVVQTRPTNVSCIVTYQKTDGTLSAPFPSNTFTPLIKYLDFPQTISTSTPPANYGCTSASVSYSLPETSCSGGPLCEGIFNVFGNYSITWQAPSGWVQTSLTNNGSNVSFTPNATSSGTLTATIHLISCSYTETRTFTITRGASAPTFTAPSVTSCTSSASMSINPTCGASNYTYAITGNAGVKFAANNLQTLTTTSTTVGINISGGYSTNTVTAKANYGNSTSSANVSADLVAGVPPPSPINTILVDYHFGKIQVESLPAIAGSPAPNYRWYKDGTLQTIYHSTFAQIPIPKNVCDVGYAITVTETNACGTSAPTYLGVYVPCDGYYYKVSPNPATSQINVYADDTKTESSLNKTFDEVRIYDYQGTLKKYQSFSKSSNALINISGLQSGNYFVEITNGDFKERQPLVIQ